MSWLKHLVGRLVRILLDYVVHVPICPKLQQILEMRNEWPDICAILSKPYRNVCSIPLTLKGCGKHVVNICLLDVNLGNPRDLQHLCRLVIRKRIAQRRLNNPRFMSALPFPPALKNYLIYKEYDLYGRTEI